MASNCADLCRKNMFSFFNENERNCSEVLIEKREDLMCPRYKTLVQEQMTRLLA